MVQAVSAGFLCRCLAACLFVSVCDAWFSQTRKNTSVCVCARTHAHTNGAHTDWHAQHAQQAARERGKRGGGKRKREEAAAFAKRVPLLKKNEDMAELVEDLRA